MTGMGQTTGKPDGDDDEKSPVDSFTKPLSDDGGGGLKLRFDASVVEEYRLNQDEEVSVEVIEENGDISFKIGNIPAGFTIDDLEAFAEDHGWERTDRYVDEDEWYLTYRSRDGVVRIEIDSQSRINGSAVNNIVIQSNPLEIEDDLDRYFRLCAVAQQKDVRVRVTDNEGLWQRLRASDHDTDDAPSPEAFGQLLDVAKEVSVELVCQRSSINTSLSDIGNIVADISDAYDQLAVEGS